MDLTQFGMSLIEQLGRIATAIENHQTQATHTTAPVAETTQTALPNGKAKEPEYTGPTHADALVIAKKLAALTNNAVVNGLVSTHGGKGQRVSDLPRDQIRNFIAACEVTIEKHQSPSDEI